MSKNILIIGATSGIAEAVARRYAEEACRFFLVARNEAKLEQIVRDLLVRGAARAECFVMDANDHARLPAMIEAAWEALVRVDVALVAHGTLPDQKRTETDIDYAVGEFRTNAESVIACLALLARRCEPQRHGVIAVIGSVAGDRGRASNYLYGSAKAAVDAFASGLRGRVFKAGVHVVTLKPGFVATPMTQGLPLPEKLVATADEAAAKIRQAIEKKKNVAYVPGFWRAILFVIKSIPESVFKRLSI
jgi:short-subunit dehydrogenase